MLQFLILGKIFLCSMVVSSSLRIEFCPQKIETFHPHEIYAGEMGDVATPDLELLVLEYN